MWDYPRPPRLEASTKLVVVRLGEVEVARTRGAYRVLETSHPPTWYLPRADVSQAALARSSAGGTVCEWKGLATYWDVFDPKVAAGQEVRRAVAWSYERPTAGFTAIAGYLSFLPAELECEIDGERVRPQQGGFYGGWITDDVVGPFKGVPGSRWW